MSLSFQDFAMRFWIVIVFIGVLFSPIYSQGNHNVSPKEVEQRIELLNKLTPINLVYNKDVQAYIDVYTVRRRDHLARIIGMSELYFPLFEEYLDKLGLPLELKYLAIVESALNPTAKSTSGAMGLWQFLYDAIRVVDLQVNSYIDERCDPTKSTIPATRYLKYLHDNFYNWDLALASYNGGIATIHDAIAKSGGKRDYWEIRSHLTQEMRSYVPAFIAVNYVMNFYESYGIEPITPKYRFDDIEFVLIEKSVSFKQLSQLLDIPQEDLSFLNPVFSKEFVPVLSSPVKFAIPKDKVSVYTERKGELYTENAPPTASLPAIGDTYGRSKVYHTVERGEFFHKIAMNYECRVEDIQKWNNLKTRNLNAGQQLLIWKRINSSPYFFVCEEQKVLN